MTTYTAALIATVLTLSALAADTNSEAALLGAIPSAVRAPTAQLAAELLEDVCPDRVNLSRPGCNDWDRTPPPGGVPPPHSINGILSGHFLSAESDDVLVSSERDETHVDRYSGTLLMTRRAGAWRALWYRSGTVTNRCMKVSMASGRDIPLCESAYIEGGHLTHDLFAINVLPTGPDERLLLETDTFAWPNRAQKETLDSVRPLVQGDPGVEAKVHYFRSDNAAGDDLSQVLQKIGEPHTIDFLLDRSGAFVVAPSNAAFFRVFSARPN
jgi:hypothetical protein